MIEELIPWLRACLDEREAAINSRPEVHAALADLLGDRLDAFACGQADRRLWSLGLVESKKELLRDVEAKRKIVRECENQAAWESTTGRKYPATTAWALAVTTLRLLALPYADRPGYREEWKP